MSEEPNQFVGSIPRTVLRMWLVRLGMVVFCGACLFLVWWSLVVRLQPATKAQRDSTLAMSRLADENDQLQLKLNAEPPEQSEARFKDARRLLFTNQDEILNWQDDAIHQGSDLGLDIKINLSPPHPLPGAEQRIAFVQAGIDIIPVATQSTNSPYQRMLQFVLFLADTDKRCDTTTLSVEGNFNSVHHATAVVRLLAEPKGAK
jgi:hypothetical protein